MSLSSAITTAQSIFNNTGLQTAIVSKNIANVSNTDYSRRMALMGIAADGTQYVSIQRAQNDALMKQNMSSLSDASAQSSLFQGLELLKSALGGNDYETSPATYLSSFRNSLQAFASSSGNASVAATAITEAKDLARSISSTSNTVQELRLDADKEIGDSVTKLNSMLAEFEKVNDAVTGAVGKGTDPSDHLDRRDRLLRDISEIISISTITRQNSDIAIYTSDGVVLFETSARPVTMTRTPQFDATTTGNQVFIDGIPVTAGTGGDTTGKGKLQALLQVRDELAPTFQAQLDELARGLVTMFKEGTAPGLFVWSGTTIPAAGTVVPGIASSLSVNTMADLNPMLLRDGGFNGIVSNTSGSSGYNALLDGYVKAMDTVQAFDPASDVDGTLTIMQFASASIGWLEQLRSDASTANDNKSAMLTRTQDALSSETGVSLDEELSLLLDLEQSYKASAKLVSTVDAMMTALLAAVR